MDGWMDEKVSNHLHRALTGSQDLLAWLMAHWFCRLEWMKTDWIFFSFSSSKVYPNFWVIMPLHRYWFITWFPLRSCSSCWFNSSMFLPNAILVWHSNIFICFLTSRSPLCKLSSPARKKGQEHEKLIFPMPTTFSSSTPWGEPWAGKLGPSSFLMLFYVRKSFQFIYFTLFFSPLSMNGIAVSKPRKKAPLSWLQTIKDRSRCRNWRGGARAKCSLVG